MLIDKKKNLWKLLFQVKLYQWCEIFESIFLDWYHKLA